MWMNTTYTGIDIKDQALFLASVVMKRGKPQLVKLDGIPVDMHHEQVDLHSALAEIASLLQEYKSMQKSFSKRVHVSIPTQHIFLRKIDTLPDVSEKQLEKLIDFEIGESIHLPFSNPVFNFFKISHAGEKMIQDDESSSSTESPQEEHEADKNSEVLLIATSHETSHQISNCIIQSGMKPLSAEICATALQRLVRFLHPDWLKSLEMIIDIDEHKVDLHFYHHGIIVFSRSISISKATYRNQSTQEEKLFFSDDEVAADTEHTDESPRSRVKSYQQRKRWNEMLYIVDLINEVEKAQNFYSYTLKNSEQVFSRLIITGDYSDSFYHMLSERVDYPVERLDFTSLLSPSFEEVEFLDCCSVAIGLALRGKNKN